jgi:uncharacterized protein YegL
MSKKNKKTSAKKTTTTTTTTTTTVVTTTTTVDKSLDTHYLLILDRSGSMSSCWASTIRGLNEQLGTIRHLEEKYPEQRYFVSLVVFDTEIDTIMENRPISEVNDFDGTEFRPRGGTALHDAMGVGISNLRTYLDKKNKESESISTALVVVMTDGEENSSREYNCDSIKKVITELENTGAWTFSYMGANQDAVLTASRFGISAGNSITYSSTSAGASAASTTLARGIMNRAKMSNVAYAASADMGDITLESLSVNNMTNNTFFSSVVDGNTIGEDLSNVKDTEDTEEKEA